MPVPAHTNPFLPAAPRGVSFFAPIQREFDRLFDQLGASWPTFTYEALTPKMDVKETTQGLEVSVELPGISKDDVRIAVDENVLTISGEKRTETETKDHDYRISERSYGAFSRSIALPQSIDTSRITATMADGVLKLTAPRNGVSKSKTIEIKSAASKPDQVKAAPAKTAQKKSPQTKAAPPMAPQAKAPQAQASA